MTSQIEERVASAHKLYVYKDGNKLPLFKDPLDSEQIDWIMALVREACLDELENIPSYNLAYGTYDGQGYIEGRIEALKGGGVDE